MVRRLALLVLSLSFVCAPSAHAASIYLPDIANGLFAVAFNPAGDPPPDTTVVDLAGTATGTVYDALTLTAIGNALAVTVPVDPDMGSDMLLATPSPAELHFSFDFASAVFNNGVLTLLGTGSGTPDSTLAAFAGPVLATFSFVREAPLNELGDSAEFYELDSIVGATEATAVPEPASLTLLGIGMAGAVARRRKARKEQA